MKPNYYTQLCIHLVFAVKFREKLISDEYQPKLYQYISGIITNKKQKSLIVNGMPDHIHILIGWNPNISISDTVRDIKRSSTLFINKNNWFAGKFSWQGGYGAFSYSQSHLSRIYNYIANQKEHHLGKSFRSEYLEMLERFEIQHNNKYLFNFFE